MSTPLSTNRPHLVLHRAAASTREPVHGRSPGHRSRGPAGVAARTHATRGLATLTIDGLPHTLFDRIVESAAANGRSIVGEVIARLESALASVRPPTGSMLARVRAIRSRMSSGS